MLSTLGLFGRGVALQVLARKGFTSGIPGLLAFLLGD